MPSPLGSTSIVEVRRFLVPRDLAKVTTKLQFANVVREGFTDRQKHIYRRDVENPGSLIQYLLGCHPCLGGASFDRCFIGKPEDPNSVNTANNFLW